MKLFSLTVLLALTFTLAGCGEEKKPEGGAAAAVTIGAKPAVAASANAKPAAPGGW
ncbi:MAG: hypothetical protein ABI193_26745 [Minicystis sp.]